MAQSQAFGRATIQSFRDGDLVAARSLVRDLAACCPPVVVRGLRDAALCATATWVSQAIAPTSVRRVVVILSVGYRVVEASRRLTEAPPFHTLSRKEIERLETELCELRSWGGTFPRPRQLYTIITESVQSTSLEIARAAGPASGQNPEHLR